MESSEEIDYSAIVNSYIKKSVVTEALEDKKNNLGSKLWEALQHYYETEENLTITESRSNKLKLLLIETIKTKQELDQEHKIMDEKIEHLQFLQTDLELKEKYQADVYVEKMETLYQEFKKLPLEFHNENMKTQIDEYNKSLEIAKLEIEVSRKKVSNPQTNLSDAELDIMNVLKDVIVILKQERVQDYIASLQQQLLLVQQESKSLEKKINELKAKYRF